jgi:hypothetical protein
MPVCFELTLEEGNRFQMENGPSVPEPGPDRRVLLEVNGVPVALETLPQEPSLPVIHAIVYVTGPDTLEAARRVCKLITGSYGGKVVSDHPPAPKSEGRFPNLRGGLRGAVRRVTPTQVSTPIPTAVDLSTRPETGVEPKFSLTYTHKPLVLMGDAVPVTPEPPAIPYGALDGEQARVSPHTLPDPLPDPRVVAREAVTDGEDARAKAMVDSDTLGMLKTALKDNDIKLATSIVSNHRVLRQVGEVLWGKHPWGTWTETLSAVPESASHLKDFDCTARLKFTPYVGEHLHGVQMIFERIIQLFTVLRKYPEDTLDLVSPGA